MKPVDTPRATPKTPSVVSHWCDMARDSDAPLCAIRSGIQGPPGVAEEDHGHHDHRQPERAARGLEQQHDAGHRHHQVHRGGLAGARGQLAVEEEDVGGAEGTDQGQAQSTSGTRSRGERLKAG
jgi:hypothetical protein